MRVHCVFLLALVACSSSPSAATAPDASDAGPEASDAGIDDAATEDASDPHTFVDPRDGHVYPTVVIGAQTWLAENMHYKMAGSFCYENGSANCDAFGRLYTFTAAAAACPPGWHIPSDDEWKTLETTLGMAANQLDIEGYATARGTTEGAALKVGGSSGFEGKLGGYASGTLFDALNLKGYFWTSTGSAGQVYRRRLDAATPILYRFIDVTNSYADSARCLMD